MRPAGTSLKTLLSFTILTMALSLTSLAKRTVLVTGANKGIGYEIARRLGAEKDTLCILGCRNIELGQAAISRLKDQGCNVALVEIDLKDDDSIQAAAKEIEDKYGTCDVLINNAAVCYNDPTLYDKVPHTPFDKQADITIQTNFFGTLALTQAMIPLLEKSSSPRIINIASSAGRLSILPSEKRRAEFSSDDLQMQQLQGYMKEFVSDAQNGSHAAKGWPNTGYGVAKVGIIAMTKVFARENPRFMVNSVDPGYCATDQNNNQGYIPAERGASTPFLLATIPNDQFSSGLHWYEEQIINW
jgi:carbonyl reductase 1